MADSHPCPNEAQLKALLAGTVPVAESNTLAAHLETCEACQMRLDSLAGQSDTIGNRVASLGTPPAQSDALEKVMAKLKTETVDQTATQAKSSAVPASLGFLSPSENPRHLGRLADYEVLEMIGRGGMGIVLKARDPKLERLVAIKVLNPELASSGAARARFLREARSAAAVTHEHVVTIHAVDDSADVPFLVMEYIVGVSLEDRIRRSGQMKVEEVLRIGMQAASGLSAAHAQGLVHRDIKPSNILLENGVERVKITDFGLARVVHEAQLTQTNAVIGTPQYMSPEQARGEPVDHRSDLFSLGCVLYAMCVGRSPFRADTPTGAIHRVCADAPRPISEVNPDIPAWLIDIIDRLLAKKPEERFQTADEVAVVMGQYLAHVQQPSRVELPPRPHRTPLAEAGARNSRLAAPILAAGVVACLILLVGGVAWFTHQHHPDLSPNDAPGPINLIGSIGGEIISYAGRDFLLVDLQGASNFSFDQATDTPGNDLSGLNPGVEILNGTPFQLDEKYIRLRGLNLDDCPDRIRNVVVGAKVDRLSFLQGAQYAQKGKQICQYEIHYEDKETEIVPVQVGIDLWDWWGEPKHAERGQVVWLGSNPSTIAKNTTLQLFRTTWINPRPDVKIVKIGISKSPQVNTSPFCVAITAELASEGKLPDAGGRLFVRMNWPSLKLELHGGVHPMTFVGGTNQGYRIEAGSYQAKLIRKTPSEDITLREGVINIAPGARVWVSAQHGTAIRSIGEPQPSPRDELPSDASVYDVAYSPEGDYLLTSHFDGSARLWRLTEHGHDQPIELKGHDKMVRRGIFSPDGTRIVLGSSDGTFSIWDVETRKRIQTVKAHEDQLKGLVFTPDGKRIISGAMREPNAKVWDADSGALVSEFPAQNTHVSRITISKDGKLLATGGALDGICKVWDVDNWTERFSVTASSDDLSAIAISPDSTMLATAGSEGTVRLWDTADGRMIQTFSLPQAIWTMAFLGTGKLIVGQMNGLITVWDVANRAVSQEFLAHWDGISSMTISPDGCRLTTGSLEATTRIWDLDQIPSNSSSPWPQPAAVFATFRGTCGASVNFSPTNDVLVAANVWGDTRWFDSTSYRPLGEPYKMNGWVNPSSLRFAPNGETVVACPGSEGIRFHDAESFQLRGELACNGQPSNAEFSPDSKSLVVCHWDKGMIEKLDSETGQRHWMTTSSVGKPDYPRISPDGSIVAVNTSTGRVLLLDAGTGKQLREPLAHSDERSLIIEFSPDGSMLATGGADGLVRLWDTSSFQERATLEGHIGWVAAITFSPDGKLMVTCDVDDIFSCYKSQRVQRAGKIIIWDVQDEKQLVEFTAHNGAVTSVDFSRDGNTIASTGLDGRVCLWSLSQLLQRDDASGKLARTYGPELADNPKRADSMLLAFSRWQWAGPRDAVLDLLLTRVAEFTADPPRPDAKDGNEVSDRSPSNFQRPPRTSVSPE